MSPGKAPLASIWEALLLNLDASGFVELRESDGSWNPKYCMPGVGSTTETVTWPLTPVFVAVNMVVIAVYEVVVVVAGSLTPTSVCPLGSTVVLV